MKEADTSADVDSQGGNNYGQTQLYLGIFPQKNKNASTPTAAESILDIGSGWRFLKRGF